MKRLLDLFCGAGGCTKGYQRAGFWVRGVDIKLQPRYCGEQFIQADALEYLQSLIDSGEIEEFDAIHASPPCQAYSVCTPNKNRHADLVAPTRELLQKTGLPYVIENVPGAPLQNAIYLCGTMFGLQDASENLWLRRHRRFESNYLLLSPPGCFCSKVKTAHVTGHMGRLVRHRTHGNHAGYQNSKTMMGIDWMTRDELSQAIPPAYTEFIGHQLMAAIKHKGVIHD